LLRRSACNGKLQISGLSEGLKITFTSQPVRDSLDKLTACPKVGKSTLLRGGPLFCAGSMLFAAAAMIPDFVKSVCGVMDAMQEVNCAYIDSFYPEAFI